MRLQAVGAAFAVTACLLHNEPTSCHVGKAKGEYARSRSESEPEQGAESDGADAKPSDLRMARLKSR